MIRRPLEREGTRSVRSVITFEQPFRLGGDPRELPAGSYTVHTIEHLFSRGDHVWSARADVTLEVRDGGSTGYRHIAPGDLDRALVADATAAATHHGLSENPDRGMA